VRMNISCQTGLIFYEIRENSLNFPGDLNSARCDDSHRKQQKQREHSVVMHSYGVAR
jgi:hypothetical protein